MLLSRLLTVDFLDPAALLAADVVASALSFFSEVVGPHEAFLVNGLPLVDVAAKEKF
jgi:hypothetical protein